MCGEYLNESRNKIYQHLHWCLCHYVKKHVLYPNAICAFWWIMLVIM